jgi:hypothetical protein
MSKRVQLIVAAHERVDLATALLERLDSDDPRFEGALEEFEEALRYRSQVESVTYH